MTISSINGVNTQAGQMGMSQTTDSYSRNIQNQIATAQEQLQELSSNENMTLEEKAKKRQEIQKQISDLNVQLRQHQIEQRRKKQQEKNSSSDDMLGGTGNAGGAKAGSQSTGLSQASMTAIISADNSMKQARIQGNVATRMEGRAGVLKSEIKQDAGNGASVERKEGELADIEQKAQAATASQISTLADASRTMKEAAKADSKAEKTDDKDTKTASAKGNDSEENVNTQSYISGAESTSPAETTVSPQPAVYKSVDIRL
ncbi:MAG: hypothetical protein HDR01_05410 [Lachnospiraceae bacterium]|nr:hypothetical protein [Lachnospiraceae bacterium]